MADNSCDRTRVTTILHMALSVTGHRWLAPVTCNISDHIIPTLTKRVCEGAEGRESIGDLNRGEWSCLSALISLGSPVSLQPPVHVPDTVQCRMSHDKELREACVELRLGWLKTTLCTGTIWPKQATLHPSLSFWSPTFSPIGRRERNFLYFSLCSYKMHFIRMECIL